MNTHLKHALTALLCTASVATQAADATAYGDVDIGPRFTASGDLIQPDGFRSWVFLGAPLTPHALNGGKAGFPEFHNVYVEAAAHRHYLATGEWPEGTVLVKELQLTQPGSHADGSRDEPSGRGYFPGTPNGLDVSVKDTRRYPATQGWGFFNFGHHAPPYAAQAAAAPREACAACHETKADADMVFSRFYQQLKPLPKPAP